MGLWTRPSIDALCNPDSEGLQDGPRLKRELGVFHLTMVGVGSTIGAGIFVITGTAAAQYAGPAIALSFVIAALVCLCTALCYGELASMMPASGGAYSYTYATMGQVVAWIIGWCLVLEYLVACSTVAVGWSSYFSSLVAGFGVPLPEFLSSAPLGLSEDQRIVATGALFNFPAAAIVLVLSAVLMVGIRKTARANILMVAIKVGIILAVVLFGAVYVEPGLWQPFVPENEGEFGAFGWSGVLRGAGVIFFAFIGFDGVSTSAQEAKDPQRDLGRSIVFGLAICTILYVAMSLVMTGLAHYAELNVANPVHVALEAVPALGWLQPLVNVGAVVGLASAILMGLYGQTRMFYAMSRDRLLPDLFQKLHPRFHTPYWGTVVVGLACALIAGVFPIDILGELVSSGALLAFTIVCASVLVLRRREPLRVRHFRVPLSPFTPLLGIVSALYLLLSLPEGTWLRLFVWMAIGLAIYFAYGLRRTGDAKPEARITGDHPAPQGAEA